CWRAKIRRALERQTLRAQRDSPYRHRADLGRGCSARRRSSAIPRRPTAGHHSGGGEWRRRQPSMMMNHIDISSMLRQTLSCDLYSNLVTRPTGAAVRGQIEQLLDDSRGHGVELTVIDFSHVAMIDFSCADEVIAKLLLRYTGDESQRTAYFVFRGVSDDHRDAIEAVLERHDLAV